MAAASFAWQLLVRVATTGYYYEAAATANYQGFEQPRQQAALDVTLAQPLALHLTLSKPTWAAYRRLLILQLMLGNGRYLFGLLGIYSCGTFKPTASATPAT